MFSLRHIAAGLTGASLLLSSAPSAFALGLGVGGTTSATSHISLPAGNGHASAKANVYLNGSVSSNTKDADDTDSSHEQKARMKTEAKAEVKVSTTALVKMKEHLHKTLARSISKIAKVYHRICYQQDSTDSAVMSCMNTAKAEFKAAVNAMIDASFSV